jgi:hypothetical protein
VAVEESDEDGGEWKRGGGARRDDTWKPPFGWSAEKKELYEAAANLPAWKLVLIFLTVISILGLVAWAMVASVMKLKRSGESHGKLHFHQGSAFARRFDLQRPSVRSNRSERRLPDGTSLVIITPTVFSSLPFPFPPTLGASVRRVPSSPFADSRPIAGAGL